MDREGRGKGKEKLVITQVERGVSEEGDVWEEKGKWKKNIQTLK